MTREATTIEIETTLERIVRVTFENFLILTVLSTVVGVALRMTS